MARTFVFVVVIIAFVAVAIQAQEGETAKPDPSKELSMSIARGKALFMDPKLGTNDMTCSSCHKQGGTVDSALGDKTLRALN
jgi:cytochrome c peroxidase